MPQPISTLQKFACMRKIHRHRAPWRFRLDCSGAEIGRQASKGRKRRTSFFLQSAACIMLPRLSISAYSIHELPCRSNPLQLTNESKTWKRARDSRHLPQADSPCTTVADIGRSHKDEWRMTSKTPFLLQYVFHLSARQDALCRVLTATLIQATT